MSSAAAPRKNANSEETGGPVHIVASSAQLPLRVRPAKRFSDDELFEFCRINQDLRIERTAEGELVIMSPTGGATGNRNFKLTAAFGLWVEVDGTGVGFDSSTGFVLPNGAERAPDVAWVERSRWESLSVEQREKFVPLCPDFVVEIRSPSDSVDELRAKLDEYMANGAALGWLVDPYARRVYVYRAGVATESLDEPRELSGAPLLSGFVLDTKVLW